MTPTDLEYQNHLCVLVLGAGSIGRALVEALRSQPSCVSLVNIADPHVEDVFQVDVLDEPNLIRNYHYVINTVPVHDMKRLAPLLVACIKYNVNYIDTNEDREIGKFVRLVGSGHGELLFAPHSGLAPGLINVLGGHMLRSYNPRSLDLRVGALTRFVDNDLLYTPTWSPEGIVNQYLNKFEVLEMLGPVTYPSVFSRTDSVPMGHHTHFLKQFSYDGIQYEAFPTSGGIATMADIHDRMNLRSIVYRSIRLNQHSAKMLSLFNACGYNRQEIVKEVTKHRIMNADDYVLVVAKADNNVTILRADAGKYLGRWMTAIQKCTVAGVAALMDLHIQGKIPPGFVDQHQIDWNLYSKSRYIEAVNYNGDRNG